jgi:alkylation response protein AidB-like acyl-CoA dehydrogenase
MLLTQDQEMIRDAVRDFVREQITPMPRAGTRNTTFPRMHQGLAALGAYGICVPEELGGAGLDYISLALVLEEIAAGDGGTSTVISVTNCPVNAILMKYGNAQQRKNGCAAGAGRHAGRLLPDRAACGLRRLGAAHHGHRDGDDYVINGVKQFITSGKNGDVAIVIAVTDKAAGKKGMSAFWCPPAIPATRWRGWKTSWASTAATRRRSISITAAFRPPT